MQGTRAAVYVRVSSIAQGEDGSSLGTQEAACREYVADRGGRVAGVYSDMHTGSEYRDRPGLSALRDQVRAGAVDVVVVYALDRLSRNQAHVYILAEELEQHDARLAVVTEDFEDSAVGRFIRSAKAFAAEVEREKIIERTQRGVRARAASGKPVSGRPLYGYRWKDGKKDALEPDPDTALIVQRIYREMAAGTTLRQIAFGLARDGIPTPSGKSQMWDISSLRYILRHPNYTGDGIALYTVRIRGKKQWQRDLSQAIDMPEGTYPPLVARAAWDAVQERLTRNQRESSRNNPEPHESLLRGGFAVCGYCGGVMQAKKSSTGNGTRKYTCNGRIDTDDYCAGRPAIAAHTLDDAVWEKVRGILLEPERIARELERLRGSDPTAADLAAIDASIRRLEGQRANVQRAIGMMADDDEDALAGLVAQLIGIAKQLRATRDERDQVLERQAAWNDAQSRLGDISAWCRRVATNLDTMTYDERRGALHALGVTAKVWRKDHAPRYQISVSIPLEDQAATATCVDPRVSRSIGP